MSFDDILGQTSAIEALTRALDGGRVHHAYRFEGPEGVGKELAAFALAQALVCEAGGKRACGTCSACQRATSFADKGPEVPLHPDVILVEQGLYPPDVLGTKSVEKQGISVDQIRRIVLSPMPYPPHEGRARVVIVRRAHELTTSAANALLKTLEEPPQRTHFILLTAQPQRLLPTVRSRTLPVRFGPLPEAVLSELLQDRGVPAARALDAIELAGGSMAAALEHADEELSRERIAFARALLDAVTAPTLAPTLALGDGVDKDRHATHHRLVGFATHLARAARELATEAPDAAGRVASAFESVLETAELVERTNGQVPLLLMDLLVGLRQSPFASIASIVPLPTEGEGPPSVPR